MIRNYLKIAVRNLMKHKGFSAINIFGLAVGMAFSIVIFLYVQHELTYDGFHENADRIFLVLKERHTPEGIRELDDTWVPMLPEMESSFPGIAGGTRIFDRDLWVRCNEKKFLEEVTYADPSVLDIFSFSLARGDAATALSDKNRAVISKAIAQKYFGDRDPIGKVLEVDFDKKFVITGVLNDVPDNSSIRTGILASFASAIDPGDEEANHNWGGSFLYTYLLLNDGTAAGSLEARFPSMVEKIWNNEGPNSSEKLKLRLLPLRDFHDWEFKTNRFAYILVMIAASILLIASINFMNLSTARSIHRAGEIGLRKVLGAGRAQIAKQFLGESMVVCTLSVLFSVVIVEMLLPVFNDLFGVNLELLYLDSVATMSGLLLLVLAVGLLSGLYPAFILSRFLPIESLRRSVGKSSGSLGLRNILVVIQFAISVTLIIGAGIIWQQIQFMRLHDLNFEKDNIVAIPVGLSDFADPDEGANRLEAWKSTLLADPGVESVAASMGVPGRPVEWAVFATPKNWNQEAPLRVRLTAIDANFLSTYEIPLSAGRNFSEFFTSDREESIIVNEAFVKAAGWQEAVGKEVESGRRRRTIVGVTKDYNFESLQSEVKPIIHVYRTAESRALDFVSVRVKPERLTVTMANLTTAWASLDPSRSFDYFFVDDAFDRLYKSEEKMVGFVGLFSLLAVVIASLGLLGLASFTVARKTKEIAIRKVIGASVGNIIFLISRKFLALVILANVIAVPVAYYLMSAWLNDYPYRVSMDPGVFVLAAIAALFFAWLTIGFQTFRAAVSNPVEALKYE